MLNIVIYFLKKNHFSKSLFSVIPVNQTLSKTPLHILMFCVKRTVFRERKACQIWKNAAMNCGCGGKRPLPKERGKILHPLLQGLGMGTIWISLNSWNMELVCSIWATWYAPKTIKLLTADNDYLATAQFSMFQSFTSLEERQRLLEEERGEHLSFR